jgi:hypothetical protein
LNIVVYTHKIGLYFHDEIIYVNQSKGFILFLKQTKNVYTSFLMTTSFPFKRLISITLTAANSFVLTFLARTTLDVWIYE